MVYEVWSPGAIGSLNLEVRGPNLGERRTCLSDDRRCIRTHWHSCVFPMFVKVVCAAQTSVCATLEFLLRRKLGCVIDEVDLFLLLLLQCCP